MNTNLIKLFRWLPILTIMLSWTTNASTTFTFNGSYSENDPSLPFGSGTFSGTLIYTPELANLSNSGLGNYVDLYTYEINLDSHSLQGKLDDFCVNVACDMSPTVSPTVLFAEELYWYNVDVHNLLSPVEVLTFLSNSQWEVLFLDIDNGFSEHLLIGSVQSASIVPIPAALWLFGSGLLGLIGLSRRKKLF